VPSRAHARLARKSPGEGRPRYERRRLGAALGRHTLPTLAGGHRGGEIELYTSPALLAELAAVLARRHLASRLQAQRSSVEQALGLYAELAIRVSPVSTPRVVPRDVDDDQVIAAALAAQADLIVSSDADPLSLESFQNIAILTPAKAVQRIRPA